MLIQTELAYKIWTISSKQLVTNQQYIIDVNHNQFINVWNWMNLIYMYIGLRILQKTNIVLIMNWVLFNQHV